MPWLRARPTPLFERVCDPEALTAAWRQVRRGSGGGLDRLSIADFERDCSDQIIALADDLAAGRYVPLPPRRFEVRRPDGRPRPIALLAVRDRIVQRAILDAVQPAFAAVASPAAFGCLPGRGAPAALARAEAARQVGLAWAVQADVQTFFERVRHDSIVRRFAAVVRDTRLADLIAASLAAGLYDPAAAGPADEADGRRQAPGRLLDVARHGLAQARRLQDDLADARLLVDTVSSWTPGLTDALGRAAARQGARLGAARAGAGVVVALGAGAVLAAVLAARRQAAGQTEPRGVPQGAPLSPLLATAVLDPLDRAVDRPDRVLIRYVDDLLVLVRHERAARAALVELRRQLARLGLDLHPAKTRVLPYDLGLVFLGTRLPRRRLAGADPPGEPPAGRAVGTGAAPPEASRTSAGSRAVPFQVATEPPTARRARLGGRP